MTDAFEPYRHHVYTCPVCDPAGRAWCQVGADLRADAMHRALDTPPRLAPSGSNILTANQSATLLRDVLGTGKDNSP